MRGGCTNVIEDRLVEELICQVMNHHCRQVGLHHDEEDRREDSRYEAVTQYLHEARARIGAGFLLHGSTGSASLFRLSVVPSMHAARDRQIVAFWRMQVARLD